ncbi:MarR family winged helix-turn-helix transcriptional regulator [Agromyces sp. NPDC058110]|uniref:MarR family winged helix-turn-helix transcriptional regulator n=1 Tax=Agromyces sp. NPDC058110 TaxID=3346345 RepID=UPI0036DD5186
MPPLADDRTALVASVLESVTLLARAITAEQKAPFGERGLSGTQMQALFTLAHSRRAVTPGRLAATLGVTPGAVTQLVDGLRGESLVQTSVNPADARSRVISLTTDAAREVERFERAVIARLAPRFDRLDEADLDRLSALLHSITEEP